MPEVVAIRKTRVRVRVVLVLWLISLIVVFMGGLAAAASPGTPDPVRAAGLVGIAGTLVLSLGVAITLSGASLGSPWAALVAISGLWLLILLGALEFVTQLPAIFIPLLGIAALAVVASLPQAERGLNLPLERGARRSAFAVAGLAVVGLALPHASPLATELTDGWSDGPPLRVGLTIASAAVSDGYVYVGGEAADVPAIGTDGAFMQVLDVGNQTRVAEPGAAWGLGTIRHVGQVAAGASGPVYVLSDWGELLIYDPPNWTDTDDPQKGGWRTAATVPGPDLRRDGALAVDLSGRLHLMGGVDYTGGLQKVDVLDPTTDQWTLGAPLASPRAHASAVTSGDGRIYLIGGIDGTGGPAASFPVEIYDPVASSWTLGANLDRPRWDHTAAQGRDGRIYVFGGFIQGEAPQVGTLATDVDVYDPETDSWSRWVGPGGAARPHAAAVSAPDGRIYLIGGGTNASQRVDILDIPAR